MALAVSLGPLVETRSISFGIYLGHYRFALAIVSFWYHVGPISLTDRLKQLGYTSYQGKIGVYATIQVDKAGDAEHPDFDSREPDGLGWRLRKEMLVACAFLFIVKKRVAMWNGSGLIPKQPRKKKNCQILSLSLVS